MAQSLFTVTPGRSFAARRFAKILARLQRPPQEPFLPPDEAATTPLRFFLQVTTSILGFLFSYEAGSLSLTT